MPRNGCIAGMLLLSKTNGVGAAEVPAEVPVAGVGLDGKGDLAGVEAAGFLADLRGFISATVITFWGTVLEVRGHWWLRWPCSLQVVQTWRLRNSAQSALQ